MIIVHKLNAQDSYIKDNMTLPLDAYLEAYWTEYPKVTVDEIIDQLVDVLEAKSISGSKWIFAVHADMSHSGGLALLDNLIKQSDGTLYSVCAFSKLEDSGIPGTVEISFSCKPSRLKKIINDTRIQYDWQFYFAGWCVPTNSIHDVLLQKKFYGGKIVFGDRGTCRELFCTSDDWDCIEFVFLGANH